MTVFSCREAHDHSGVSGIGRNYCSTVQQNPLMGK